MIPEAIRNAQIHIGNIQRATNKRIGLAETHEQQQY